MGVKELDWLNKELSKDEVEVTRHKEKLIQNITSVDRQSISNTVSESVTEKPKKFGLLWRLKKVLGM